MELLIKMAFVSVITLKYCHKNGHFAVEIFSGHFSEKLQINDQFSFFFKSFEITSFPRNA